jgi:paraquat-inducible protein B
MGCRGTGWRRTKFQEIGVNGDRQNDAGKIRDTGDAVQLAEPIPAPEKAHQKDWVPSLIWLIPILAALIGISLAVNTVIQRGPEITILFNSGEGLETGKTRVKYKEVEIGLVQSITLSEDRSYVLVRVQLTKEARSFTAADSRFWVVRPRLALSGVSELGTLLFGPYIGAEAGVASEKKDTFTGLESAPIVTRDASGKKYALGAADLGSLDIGSPVYYRRMKVGQVVAFDLDEEGKGVTVRIFVNAPYDRLVGINTRFWNASGVDLQVSPTGFSFQAQSLATVVLGGLSFQSPEEGPGPAAAENTAFTLAASQAEAMTEKDGEPRMILLYFKQSVRGLTPGAEISFRGVVLGKVKSVGIEYDRKQREFVMPVLGEVYPARLGPTVGEDGKQPRYTAQQRLQSMLDRGLAAQLRTASLLTGQVYIALDLFPKVAPSTVAKKEAEPAADEGEVGQSGRLIELPTIPGGSDEIQAQISEITLKLSKVPFDQIGNDLQQSLHMLRHTLDSVSQLSAKLNNDVAPEITVAIQDSRKSLVAVERTLAEDAPLQQDLRQTLQELGRAAASLRVLTDYLERRPEAIIRGKRGDKH